MKFDLTDPCRHCPFRSDENGMRFASRERAEEIEETAYRYGFPCHMSAVLAEGGTEADTDGGYVFGEKSQYCAGHIIHQCLADTGSPWPGIDNDHELLLRLERQVNLDAPVFATHEELAAESGPSAPEAQAERAGPESGAAVQ